MTEASERGGWIKGRRVNGEGTVARKPRADGQWVARYTVVEEDGSVRRPVLYAKTRAEVSRKLRDALAARDRGERRPGKQTVADYLATWHDGTRPQLRPQTWQRQGEHVRLHLVPTVGRFPMHKLAPVDVQRAYAQLLERGLSAATVRRTHAVLHRALGQAVRWRLLAANVADMVDPPRVSRAEMAAFSPVDARRFVAAVRGDRLEALYVVALTTGLRQGELLALRWAEVDLDAAWLQVTGSLVRDRGELGIAETKTARSRRRVELAAIAVDALRAHKLAQLEQRVALANVWQDRGLVFASETGGFIGKSTIQKHFPRLLAAAGLPRIRFHDLRHTAATLMLGRGVHPKVAADMLGHSTIAVTLDLYSHVTPTMQREAVAAFDDLLQ